MAAHDLASLLADLGDRDRLTAEDALAVRRVVFGDVEVTPQEAETLIWLNEATEDVAPEWRQMFVEALTDFIVRQQHPPGYVDEANADWLMGALGRDDRVSRDTEMALLVHILEHATTTPSALAQFTLDQAKAMVLAGERPLTNDDVVLLRRIVFASAGAGSLAITRAEAEVLFDINDAVRGRENDAAWTDFFAKAIGNAVMAASGYAPPSREEALRTEAWLEERSSIARALARTAMNLFRDPSKVLDSYGAPGADRTWDEKNAAEAAERAASEVVTNDEAAWIAARVGRDGELDENEQALLRFLASESPNLHPSLQPLLDRAA